MKTQIISINPDGSLGGLQHKRGQGLDLRQFGKAEIQRVTLIEWDESTQKWFIRWQNHFDNRQWRTSTVRCAMPFIARQKLDQLPEDDTLRWTWAGTWEGIRLLRGGDTVCSSNFLNENERNSVLGFDDYEDAVTFEVAVVQAYQLAGKLSLA